MQADSILSGMSDKNSQMTVDYHERYFLEMLNQENGEYQNSTDRETFSPPQNSIAFDRYAYSLNNPNQYIDPSGHDAIPPAPLEWLQWLNQKINIICRNPSPAIRGILFGAAEKGTRILIFDRPHGNIQYYHLNSDLRLLQGLTKNHPNMEPVVGLAAATFTQVKTAVQTAGAAMMNIASGEVFFPFIIITPPTLEDFLQPFNRSVITKNPRRNHEMD